MKRTRLSENENATMVNYYDRNKAQRWGRLEKEDGGSVIVRDVFGDRDKVPKSSIIKERKITEEKANLYNIAVK